MEPPRTLVLGFGNATRGDDGIGVHAIAHLETRALTIPGVRLLDGGTSTLELLEHIELCDNLIVIDAAELHAPAGEIRCFVDTEMDRQLGGAKRTAHEVALRDLIDMARLRDALPRRRALIGIQPHATGWSATPSPQVLEALPDVCERVMELARKWTVPA